jgi:hypothetical protein
LKHFRQVTRILISVGDRGVNRFMQHAVFRAILAIGVQIGGKEAFLGHDVG